MKAKDEWKSYHFLADIATILDSSFDVSPFLVSVKVKKSEVMTSVESYSSAMLLMYSLKMS